MFESNARSLYSIGYTPGCIPGLLRRSELCKDESQTASILYTVRSPPNEETTDVVTGKVMMLAACLRGLGDYCYVNVCWHSIPPGAELRARLPGPRRLLLPARGGAQGQAHAWWKE